MRLLSKISYNYFLLSAFVLAITGIVLFMLLRNEVSLELKEQLELQADMIAEEIRGGKAVNFPLVQISKGENLLQLPPVFKDTLLYDRIQHVKEGYYYLEESRRINKEVYRIRVLTTYIGWENYSKAIGYIFISIALMLIVLGALMNYFINLSIWKTFMVNLKLMKSFSVTDKEELILKDSSVTEFREMNTVLSDLAMRSKKEYTALKEFTENASHEIQTPLSILKSRLESISQLPVEANLASLLKDAKQAVNRLSRVNKGLLLLAKIENNVFPDKQLLGLDVILNKHFEQMEDLFQHKNIDVELKIMPKQVFASISLMEVLISNLLSNIIANVADQASVSISLNDREMQFCNEGKPLVFPASNLFKRFGKGVPSYKGNGLGLSIVKQICVINQWQIVYSYENGQHIFTVLFDSV